MADASISYAALRSATCNGKFYLRLIAVSPHGVVLEKISFVCLYNASIERIVHPPDNFFAQFCLKSKGTAGSVGQGSGGVGSEGGAAVTSVAVFDG